MYVKDYLDTPAEPAGAAGLSARWVINASQGATSFAMRIIEVEPGIATPFHQHEHEHEMFVFEGLGQLTTPSGVVAIAPGSVIFIPANEQHQFKNTGESPLRMTDVMLFALIPPK